MPAPRLVLPGSLAGRPFTVEEGRRAGLTPGQLRASPVLRRPYPGVRVPSSLPDSLRTRCLAAQLLLPARSAFDGATGAALLELPLPRALDPLRPLVVRVPPGTEVRVRGVRSTVGPLPVRAPRSVTGSLRVVPAAQVWAGLASDRHMALDDLVVLGDAVARRRGGLASLRAVTSASAGRRGVKVMRAALDLVRERVDSPQETRTRLLLLRAGIPEAECGLDVFGDDGTTWLARADLCWPQVKVALEYDGETHRTDRRQWRSDLSRRELLDDHGWALIVVTGDDLDYRRTALVRRVERRLVDRGLQLVNARASPGGASASARSHETPYGDAGWCLSSDLAPRRVPRTHRD